MEAKEAASEVAVCRHWQRMGFCLYVERCRFRHPPREDGPSPSSDLASTSTQPSSAAESRRNAFAKLCNERCKNRGEGKRNKIMNRSKAGCFRRFLEDTFGLETLASGTGVLDVAGGKGELSFELANLTGIRTTVIDPRPLRLDRYVKRLLVGIYHRTGPLQSYNHIPMPSDKAEVRTPGHLPAFFDDNLLRVLELHGQNDQEAADAFCQHLADARKVVWTEKGLVTESNTKEQSEESREHDERPCEDATTHEHEITDWPAAQQLLAQCGLIVGLHPDQATEAIIDFALRWNKGFAVVPCCVYHKQFPRRRLNGASVTTYDQFVAYLLAKEPNRIKTAKLDFEGKNLVLYAFPLEDHHHK